MQPTNCTIAQMHWRGPHISLLCVCLHLTYVNANTNTHMLKQQQLISTPNSILACARLSVRFTCLLGVSFESLHLYAVKCLASVCKAYNNFFHECVQVISSLEILLKCNLFLKKKSISNKLHVIYAQLMGI